MFLTVIPARWFSSRKTRALQESQIFHMMVRATDWQMLGSRPEGETVSQRSSKDEEALSWGESTLGRQRHREGWCGKHFHKGHRIEGTKTNPQYVCGEGSPWSLIYPWKVANQKSLPWWELWPTNEVIVWVDGWLEGEGVVGIPGHEGHTVDESPLIIWLTRVEILQQTKQYPIRERQQK